MIEIKTNKGDAILYKGHPKGDTPKTYKKIDVLSHNIGGNYSPELLTLFKAKDGSLRYEIYRDGSIYPFYGKIKFKV
jgi:hypothetical protein